MSEIIYKEESYKIIGACYNVYNKIGAGFLESVYQECLKIEFEYQDIEFLEQKEIEILYRDKVIKNKFRADFICYDKIILEIKAVANICSEHRVQVLNYLNATGYKLGILINFGSYPKIEYERIAL